MFHKLFHAKIYPALPVNRIYLNSKQHLHCYSNIITVQPGSTADDKNHTPQPPINTPQATNAADPIQPYHHAQKRRTAKERRPQDTTRSTSTEASRESYHGHHRTRTRPQPPKIRNATGKPSIVPHISGKILYRFHKKPVDRFSVLLTI